MKTRNIILAASALIALGAPAFAQTATVDTPREIRQQERIDQGIESGALNENEAKRLEKGTDRIDSAQERALKDGEVSAQEKAHIKKMEDVQSKRIYREKHDKQTAFSKKK